MTNSFSVFLSLPIWFAALYGVIDVKAYSQISTYGSTTKDDGPKIFKAINADLIFPETFNSSNNVISTTKAPLTVTTLATFPAHYPQDSVSDSAIAVTPVIYVTPPTQTSFTPQMHNGQTMESNQMQVATQSDYPKELLREEAYENVQLNDNQHQQQHQQQHHQQQQQQQQFTSTGRAIDYRPAYQLDQFMNAAKHYKAPPSSSSQPYVLRPTVSYPVRSHKGQTTQYNSAKVLPYPQTSYRQYQRPQQVFRRPPNQAAIYNLNGRDGISDRFTPGEAVASALFTKNNQKHNHNRNNHGNKVASASNFIQSYASPKDLYSFPPNINAKYPKPSEDSKAALASISVNSYAPPAAGPIKTQANYPLVTLASNNEGYQYNGPVSPTNNNEGYQYNGPVSPTNNNEGYQYNGPVNPSYIPPNGVTDGKTKDETNMKPMDTTSTDTDADAEDGDDTIGVLPASAMDTGDNDSKTQGIDSDVKDMSDINSMPTNDGSHDHDHTPDHPPIGYDTGKEYPTPPPGWMDEHPHHDHGPSIPYFSHHFPDIIYDDHHHDFHHDHYHPIELPSTTMPPLPEPLPSEQPQEPRVKKYSYFYIGRKLWYIPLYFTVWFSFYVLWLILKSIARHKVNLPNHYQARRSLRSLPNYTDDKAKEYINHLTVSVLQQIESFQKKYIT